MATQALPTVRELAGARRSGTFACATLVEEALARAQAPEGEGARTFTRIYADSALADALHVDARRAAAAPKPALEGVPVSIKDLFDVAGDVTTAGSRVLCDAAPATSDAIVVGRLRAAGAVLVGRTNMTEFAYSGLGLNPHFGTPRNPHDRERGRIPGGSSSGAAIAITDGMCVASIGTDTGGSVRIPAALCGIVGFKPTASRIDMRGTLPLSPALDSIGVLARTVDCCGRVDAAIADAPAHADGVPPPQRPRRLGVPSSYVLDDLDATVAAAFERTLRELGAAGVALVDLDLPLDEIPAHSADGGIVAIEAYAWHEPLFERHRANYDPQVASRIARGRGRGRTAAEYLRLCAWRREWIRRMGAALDAVDAMVMPTVPVVAPPIAPLLADDEAYARTNLLLLRNPTVVNMADGCAVSLPCQREDELPVGLTIAGPRGGDTRILSIARWVEEELARSA